MTGKRVTYNGHEMAAEWPPRIEAAQAITAYDIGGVPHPRVPYGQERDGPFPEPCHDCGVLHGQYHVELCCDMEECPRCHGQVIGCDCPYDDDEAAAPEAHQETAFAPAHWNALLDRVKADLGSYRIFLEAPGGSFIHHAHGAAVSSEALALALVPSDALGNSADSAEDAAELAARLIEHHRVDAVVLLNRDPESFVGYYVRVRG